MFKQVSLLSYGHNYGSVNCYKTVACPINLCGSIIKAVFEYPSAIEKITEILSWKQRLAFANMAAIMDVLSFLEQAPGPWMKNVPFCLLATF